MTHQATTLAIACFLLLAVRGPSLAAFDGRGIRLRTSFPPSHGFRGLPKPLAEAGRAWPAGRHGRSGAPPDLHHGLPAASAFALDVVVKDVRAPASSVIARIDIRDPVPDRFKKLLDDGGVLHLRLQAELWESRPVWDRLVYPAIVRVFRLGRAPSSRDISIADAGVTTSTYATIPNPMPLVVDLGRNDRVEASAKYYLHVMATLGTLAEHEADDVGDAVFGRESEANSLGSLGRLVFRTMIKVSDYLQSVSAETTTRKTTGAEILKRP